MRTDAAFPIRKTEISLLVLLLLLGLCFVIHRVALVAEVNARLDAIRKTGQPTTPAELAATLPQPPSGENAASVYQEAYSHYDSKYIGNELIWRLPPRSEPLSPEAKQEIANCLAANQQALELFRKAAAMKSCHFPLNFAAGWMMQTPHVSLIQSAGWLLRNDAILHCENGDSETATRDILAIFRLADTIREEPLLIPFLVRITNVGMAVGVMERLLNRVPLADNQLERLSAATAKTEDSQALTRAFIGDRCLATDGFTAAGSEDYVKSIVDFNHVFGDPVPLWERVFFRGAFVFCRISGQRELDHLKYLDLMMEAAEASRIDYPDRLRRLNAIREKAEKLPFYLIGSRVSVPSVLIAAVRDARSIALGRIVLAALAVERFRNDAHRLPESLAELAPRYLNTVPIDPFDGKPVRYKLFAAPKRGYVVYSVGEDGKDDGGAGKSKRGPSSEPDITFTVER
ncbi:MAG: hypothetical protein WA117_06840 [Verrucomicrobiia bacterium]